MCQETHSQPKTNGLAFLMVSMPTKNGAEFGSFQPLPSPLLRQAGRPAKPFGKCWKPNAVLNNWSKCHAPRGAWESQSVYSHLGKILPLLIPQVVHHDLGRMTQIIHPALLHILHEHSWHLWVKYHLSMRPNVTSHQMDWIHATSQPLLQTQVSTETPGWWFTFRNWRESGQWSQAPTKFAFRLTVPFVASLTSSNLRTGIGSLSFIKSSTTHWDTLQTLHAEDFSRHASTVRPHVDHSWHWFIWTSTARYQTNNINVLINISTLTCGRTSDHFFCKLTGPLELLVRDLLLPHLLWDAFCISEFVLSDMFSPTVSNSGARQLRCKICAKSKTGNVTYTGDITCVNDSVLCL